MKEKDVGNAPENAGSDSQGTGVNSQETVSYQSFSKLLDQKKKTDDKLKEMEEALSLYRSKEKEAEEQKLREQGEYQKLVESREKDLEEAKREAELERNRASDLQKTLIDSAKLQAVVERIPGRVKNKDYMAFIDVDSVAIDPETNTVDMSSVENVANSFLKNHPSLIDFDNRKKLPNEAGSPGQALSYEAWLKLPLKEKREKMGEVMKLQSNQ